MNKSFAPKLTDDEAVSLSLSIHDYETAFTDRLVRRGLLCRVLVEMPYTKQDGFNSPYRVTRMEPVLMRTKRGNLMLQRYQKEQTRRKWAEADRLAREAVSS